MKGRVLIIAGSDSGGGAGIQADIKTVTALGGFAMTAVTAVTVQNTLGVSDIHSIPPEIVEAQIKAVLSDLGADAIKIGMLHSSDIIDAVHRGIADYSANIPVVVDPVMVAKGGASLLENEASLALKEKIIPLATVLTPNLPEAEVLVGHEVEGDEAIVQMGKGLCAFGAEMVLLKGGHIPGDMVTDRLFANGELVETFESPRFNTPHTHGTGCTLASAISAGLAQNLSIKQAITRARDYVLEAIRTAPGYGKGHGPLNHGHPLVTG
ncbi:MAG: bifunctional hydroxymethylpyrimidine kinase/phosphomethylpyrimidine kinase [Rhodospirillales bacterium]|nr:bifunctional hydroxymethylpyrimidine kinase/phosphomethylpyrimidine kinase [Rhodospirillales bacterium]